jgi:hypothetical protein
MDVVMFNEILGAEKNSSVLEPLRSLEMAPVEKKEYQLKLSLLMHIS